MNSAEKIAIGLGIASGVIIMWLLTGSRKQKTQHFISQKKYGIKESFKPERARIRSVYDDYAVYYS